MVVVLTKEGNAGGIANLKVKITSFFLDMLNLSGLWDIPVKGSCVENGNLGPVLSCAGMEFWKCWPTGDRPSHGVAEWGCPQRASKW